MDLGGGKVDEGRVEDGELETKQARDRGDTPRFYDFRPWESPATGMRRKIPMERKRFLVGTNPNLQLPIN